MGLGQQMAASITGNVEQALLIIHDFRAVEEPNPEVPNALERLNNLKKSALRVAAAKAAQLEKIAAALEGDAALLPDFVDSTRKTFRVQFNPSSIRLNSSAMITNKRDAAGKFTEEIVSEAPTMTMSTKLLFNDLHNFDAFMWEKIQAGINIPIGTAKLAAYAIESAKKTWSVQDETEALVAALRNPRTRNITFRWADFVFAGQLNSVQVNYTMFSTSGRPIRAEIMLRLQHEMDENMLQQWHDDFDKVFDGDGAGSLVKRGQGVGNLLNLMF